MTIRSEGLDDVIGQLTMYSRNCTGAVHASIIAALGVLDIAKGLIVARESFRPGVPGGIVGRPRAPSSERECIADMRGTINAQRRSLAEVQEHLRIAREKAENSRREGFDAGLARAEEIAERHVTHDPNNMTAAKICAAVPAVLQSIGAASIWEEIKEVRKNGEA